MLLVQGRVEIAVIPAVTADSYITVLWIQGLSVMLLVQVRKEITVTTAVTVILLHHSAKDTGTGFILVSTG